MFVYGELIYSTRECMLSLKDIDRNFNWLYEYSMDSPYM